MAEVLSAALHVGIIVQARVSSTRLPGKALLPLPMGKGVTLFQQILRRVRRARAAVTLIAALPDNPADDPLEGLAHQEGVLVWRGSEADVLARFVGAARRHELDVIVRLTADNPAVDPAYVDMAVREHLKAGADYTLTAGLPLGMNVEVISRVALEAAHAEAAADDEREHVTPFIRRRPDRFRLLSVPVESGAAGLRLTVDYPTDYALQHLLYSVLGPSFGLAEVLTLYAQHSWLAQINDTNEQVRV